MEEAEKCWVELRQMRDSRDGADVIWPWLPCGMVAKPGREAAFPCCSTEMAGGNLVSWAKPQHLGSLSRGGE